MYLGHELVVSDYKIKLGDNLTTTVDFPRDNQWHNYAIVRNEDVNNTFLYLDGALVYSTGSVTLSPVVTDVPNNFILGAQYDNLELFQGNIDELRIFNRALSHSEVVCNSKGTLLIFALPLNLVADYNFEPNNSCPSFILPLGGTLADSPSRLITPTNMVQKNFIPSIDITGVAEVPFQNYDANIYYDRTNISPSFTWNSTDFGLGNFCMTAVSGSGLCLPPFAPSGIAVADRTSNQKQTNGKFALSLFPNPAQNYISIILEGVDKTSNLTIFDTRGREVSVRKIEAGTESLLWIFQRIII